MRKAVRCQKSETPYWSQQHITLIAWSNLVQQHCDSKKTYILLDFSEASQQGGTMQEYKFSTMLLLIE